MLLGLSLQGLVGLHEIIVEGYKLLHFREGVLSHLLVRLLLALGQVVDAGKLLLHLPGVCGHDLVFLGEELDPLLVFLLLGVLLVSQGVDLILGDLEVVQDDVSQLVEGLDLLGLQDLLGSEQLLERPSHLEDRAELLGGNQSPKLVGQVSNRLNVRDFPVEEPAEVTDVFAIKVKEVPVRLLDFVLLLVEVVLAIEALLDEEVLTQVDLLVETGFGVTELCLLLLQFDWLFQCGDLAAHL